MACLIEAEKNIIQQNTEYKEQSDGKCPKPLYRFYEN